MSFDCHKKNSALSCCVIEMEMPTLFPRFPEVLSIKCQSIKCQNHQGPLENANVYTTYMPIVVSVGNSSISVANIAVFTNQELDKFQI